MKEILLTSSLLILALLALRYALRDVLSRRVQYALWALVLLRLLIPGSLFSAPFSMLTLTRPVEEAVTQRIEAAPPVYVFPTSHHPISEFPHSQAAQPGDPVSPDVLESFGYWVVDPSGETVTRYVSKMGAVQALTILWKLGMAITGTFFLTTNLLFYLHLKRLRTPYEAPDTKRPVYLVPEGALLSPCLFGLFRPAIYLTPAAVATEADLRHVLLHEETHAKHLDPLWSLLRCLCLTIYWFDPLVWAAALCARTDCELACDESALLALEGEARLSYGQTLLSLIPVKGPGNPLLSATTMTAGKRQLRDRIRRIAKSPRQFIAATLAVALLAGVLAACAFTGRQEKTPESTPLTAEELAFFNEEFFNEGGVDMSGGQGTYYSIYPDKVLFNIRNAFLTSLYNCPEDVDLYELMYMGPLIPGADDIADFNEGVEVMGSTEGPKAKMPGKMTPEYIDPILTVNTGTGWKDSHKVGLEKYTYSEKYDAYFWQRPSDSNYPGNVDFTAGTRRGDHVTLYYQKEGDWRAVTLKEAGKSWHIVSHTLCDDPGLPTPEAAIALPAGEPLAVLSLTELATYPLYATEDGFAPDWEDEAFLRDLQRLVAQACPELDNWYGGSWDPALRCYTATGWSDYLWRRRLVLDGQSLLVYPGDIPTVDHMAMGADVNVPAPVVAAARSYAESQLELQADGTWRKAPLAYYQIETYDGKGLVLDDWRVERLTNCGEYPIVGNHIMVWSFNYECHTPTPKNVGLVGGMYVTEDGWVSPGYPNADYLVFLLEDGQYSLLTHTLANDIAPGSWEFREWLSFLLEDMGVPEKRGTYAAERTISSIGQTLLSDARVLLASPGESGNIFVPGSLGDGKEALIADLADSRWTPVDPPAQEPDGPSVTLAQESWLPVFQVWDSGLAMYWGDLYGSHKMDHYQVEGPGGQSVYQLMRDWYLRLAAGGTEGDGFSVGEDIRVPLDALWRSGFRLTLGLQGGKNILIPAMDPDVSALLLTLCDDRFFHWQRVEAPQEPPAGPSITLFDTNRTRLCQFWEDEDLALFTAGDGEGRYYRVESQVSQTAYQRLRELYDQKAGQ